MMKLCLRIPVSFSWLAITTLSILVTQPAFAVKKKTFVYCSEASPSTFNPQMAMDGTTFNASSRTVYNRLVEFKPGQTAVEPGLATKWTFDANTMTYTFTLRRNVIFHTTKYFKPTRPFNADDVLFSFNRQRLKKHPYHLVGGGRYEYFESMDMGKIIANIIKVDDYTVQFKLTKTYAPFIANLAMDFASILSKEYADRLIAKKKKQDLDRLPVGTGPFVFKRYVKDALIRYYAHPKFFRGKAAIDKLVFSINADASVRYQKLKAGECHLMTEPAAVDIKAMKKDARIKVMERPGLNVGYLAMNVRKKPFDNVLVRRAIHHALNRQAYIDVVYRGNAVVAKNPIPPSMWSYNKKIADYDYSPAKAKALLKEAGFAAGFKTELWVLPVSRPYNPNGKKMGELMQADLAKVGIAVKLVTYDWPTYLQKSKQGEHSLLQMGWTGDNGDPDNFLNVLLSCSAVNGGANRAGWCDKQFNELILTAVTTSDKPQRTLHYQAAQKRFKMQAPWVTLAHSIVYRSMSHKVVGYKIDPFGGDYFYGVDLK